MSRDASQESLSTIPRDPPLSSAHAPYAPGCGEAVMMAYHLNRSKPKSLAAQIRDAERHVLKRQQKVGVRASTLVRKIHRLMTAPATLLLASGIGFIVGELTKRQTNNSRGNADKQSNTVTTPLRTALNLMTSAHTLYTALPITWIMKTFHQTRTSSQAPVRQFRTVSKRTAPPSPS